MGLIVRRLNDSEARAWLELHHRSVRGLAAGHYPPDVIAAWAPPVVSDDEVAAFMADGAGQVRLVAEQDGGLVGVACLVAATGELRACYVAPAAARQGVGTALVRALEQAAREAKVPALTVMASLNAEGFYERLGYAVVERRNHRLESGVAMAAVLMRRELTEPARIA
ncbi:MAG: GNAT family N-acetyltransferase [Alphaproteobacteria bacterium]